MSEHTVNIDVNELTRKMTLNVKLVGVRKMKFKMKIAVALIMLATRVLGCELELDNE